MLPRNWGFADYVGCGMLTFMLGILGFGIWAATSECRNHNFGQPDVIHGVVVSVQPFEKGVLVQLDDKRYLPLRFYGEQRAGEFCLGYETDIYLDPGTYTIRKIETCGTPITLR